MKWSVRLLVILCLGFVFLYPRLLPAQGRSQLKVLTFNLHGFQDDWPARQDMILSELTEIEPDIIGLQEVLETPGQNGEDNSARVLAQRLTIATGKAYNYRFVDTHFAWGAYDEGLAIVTPHIILDSDVRLLPATIFQRKALWARILTPEGIVHFVTTHLDHLPGDEANREAQVAEIKSFMAVKDQQAHVASIVCGDFNTTPEAPSIQQLVAGGVQDRFIDTWFFANPGDPGYTSFTPNPMRRIDYVFLREVGATPDLEVRQILDQPDSTGLFPSDHIGVMTALTTPVELVPVQLNGPEGGERVSGIVPISWSFPGSPDSVSASLYLSPDGGSTWDELLDAVVGDSSYEWQTMSYADGTRFLFRVVVIGDSTFGLAESGAAFSVDNPGNAAPDVTLSSPVGGEEVAGTMTVTWDAQDADGDSLMVSLESTTNGGMLWLPIVHDFDNVGQYDWDISGLANSERYQIRLTCTDDSTQVVLISKLFSVLNPRASLGKDIFEHVTGQGSGTLEARIVDGAQLTGHTYEITFDDTSSAAKAYDVFDTDLQQLVVQGAQEIQGITEGPLFHGLRLVVTDLAQAIVDGITTGWLTGSSTLNITLSNPVIVLGSETLRGFPYPADYELSLFDHVVDTSSALWGVPARPIPFQVINVTEDRPVEVLYLKTGSHTLIEQNDEVYIIERDALGQPMLTWLIFFSGFQSATLPLPGDTFLLATQKPFSHRDVFRFSASQTHVDVSQIPLRFELAQNYPNPFNPSTTIHFEVDEPGHVRLEVFNLLGQKVATLARAWFNPGAYSRTWDGRSSANHQLASGVYLYRLTAVDRVLQKKMLYLR